MNLIESLQESLAAAAAFGTVRFNVQEIHAQNGKLAEYLESQGLRAQGWQQADSEDAMDRIESMLHKHLAYCFERMPRNTAAMLTGQIEALIGADARCYVNDTNDATSATFNSGIAFLTENHIGFICVEDED